MNETDLTGKGNDYSALLKRGEPLVWPEDLVLITDPAHPLYDERVLLPLSEPLILNIMAKGVLLPLLVRRNGERDGVPVLEVVDGRQRTRAAVEANKRLRKEGKQALRVPVRFRRGGDDADIFGVLVAANEFRASDATMVKARKIARYLEMGRTDAEAAVTFGLSAATIGNYMALFECVKEVQDAVEQRKIPLVAARRFVKVPREEQAAVLAPMLEAGGVATPELDEAIADARAGRRIANGKGERKKSAGRALSKKRVIKLMEALGEANTKDANLAWAVLKYVLGKARASIFDEHPSIAKVIAELDS